VVEADRVLVVGEGFFELFHILRNALESGLDALRRVVHLDAGLDRPLGLLLQILGATIPELSGVEHGVEYGRRVARAFLPTVADGGRYVIAATDAEVVAGVAADHMAAG